MKAIRLICTAAVVSAIVGCSIPRAPNTAQFYEQEAIAARICLSPLEQMPMESRLKLSPTNGRSPFTTAALCYSSQMDSVVRMLNYPHAALVNGYADYLVNLTTARDNGTIDTSTALMSYKQTSTLFRQAIANADQQIEAAARRELADRLAVFAQAMSDIALEQERQRQANRPVTCRLTGVYVMNTITCM